MTEDQINQELSRIENDDSLSYTEKRIYHSIYSAELSRQKYDNLIDKQKNLVRKLRMKIINDIINIYSKLDELKKTTVDNMLHELGMERSIKDLYIINDIVYAKRVEEKEYVGRFTLFVDSYIHGELYDLKYTHKQLIESIDKKQRKLESILHAIVNPELFIMKKDNEYKNSEEFDTLLIKENEKIDNLNVGEKEKEMLKNILIDVVKYGKSHGTMYDKFDDVSIYIKQKQSSRGNKVR